MWTLSPTHTGRIKASVFEVDPKVLSRNAPESIGESKHFTIASSLRGEVTATPTKIAAYLIEKIGSAASGYFHPSLWLSESHDLLVKLAPLGISIRAPTRSVLDDRHDWPIVMPAQA